MRKEGIPSAPYPGGEGWLSGVVEWVEAGLPSLKPPILWEVHSGRTMVTSGHRNGEEGPQTGPTPAVIKFLASMVQASRILQDS